MTDYLRAKRYLTAGNQPIPTEEPTLDPTEYVERIRPEIQPTKSNVNVSLKTVSNLAAVCKLWFL